MKSSRWVAPLLLLALLVGCQSGPDRCRTNQALFADSFSDTACGWGEYDKDRASAGYAEDEYAIAVHQPNTSAVAVPGAEFGDVTIRVEARAVAGSPNNNFGLLCRFRDMQNFDAFLISSDGYYAIAQIVDGAPYRVLSGDGTHLMPSQAIDTQSGAVNEIQAVCAGDSLTLYVNGQHLASVRDEYLSSGDIGLIVSTYEEGPSEVRFDNVVVLEPATPAPQSN